MMIGTYQITRGTLIIIGAIVVIILLLASVFFGFIPGSRPAGQTPVTLEFWGLYDDLSVWQKIFNDFKKENSNIFFNYVQMNPETYERDLLEALASGKRLIPIFFSTMCK